jgi:hypothetical protein
MEAEDGLWISRIGNCGDREAAGRSAFESDAGLKVTIIGPWLLTVTIRVTSVCPRIFPSVSELFEFFRISLSIGLTQSSAIREQAE